LLSGQTNRQRIRQTNSHGLNDPCGTDVPEINGSRAMSEMTPSQHEVHTILLFKDD
jgi:hypothetical protein